MTPSILLMALASIAGSVALGEALLAATRSRDRDGGRRARRGTAARRRAGTPVRRARWSLSVVADERTERLLDAAGRRNVPDSSALATQRSVAAAIGGGWAFAAAFVLVPLGVAIGIGFAGAALGRAVPVALLARAGKERTTTLRDDSPELLDLLAVALSCGLPIGAALAAVGAWGKGPLAAAAAVSARELDHGAGIDPTLARLVREHPADEIDAAIAILQRSRRHGTAAAAPMRALAAAARQDRARRTMDHAARAAPRVQLVAALLLVPAALCVLASAMVAGGLGSG